ncbi:hypothetical protein SELMODRAFT_421513 [Selaginella moellendorffii]|uniref:Uncharacterized protein n=1 Tax=Selaginella moellendorffii TaxID=88036 RepID=D8SFI4_SELML|nr:hypothetical protein SELMODRAFT_421513 [Selaginella moellendorffii]
MQARVAHLAAGLAGASTAIDRGISRLPSLAKSVPIGRRRENAGKISAMADKGSVRDRLKATGDTKEARILQDIITVSPEKLPNCEHKIRASSRSTSIWTRRSATASMEAVTSKLGFQFRPKAIVVIEKNSLMLCVSLWENQFGRLTTGHRTSTASGNNTSACMHLNEALTTWLCIDY